MDFEIQILDQENLELELEEPKAYDNPLHSSNSNVRLCKVKKTPDDIVLLDFSRESVRFHCKSCMQTGSYHEHELLCKRVHRGSANTQNSEGFTFFETYFECNNSACNSHIKVSTVKHTSGSLFNYPTRVHHKGRITKDWSRQLIVHYMKQQHETDCPVHILCPCSGSDADEHRDRIPVPRWNCTVNIHTGVFGSRYESVSYMCPLCMLIHTTEKKSTSSASTKEGGGCLCRVM